MANRAAIVIGVAVAIAAATGVGILIGHFAIPPRGGSSVENSLQKKCGTSRDPLANANIKAYINESETKACQAVTCELPYPVTYVIYHLKEDSIRIDGRLDDAAWQTTPRIDGFVNIQGPEFPGPTYTTYAMLRWDDDFLYVGAYLQDPHMWANQTEKDSRVFLDNAFEVFVDTDFSTHWYKEWQINVINTTWDLMVTKPYADGGVAQSEWELTNSSRAVFVNGTPNDPSDIDNFWSFEIAMPIRSLVENTSTSGTPSEGDQWRINLSRVQYDLEIVGGVYWKKAGSAAKYWVWSPQYAVALHHPERWGMVQFSKSAVGGATYTKWQDWNVYSSLVKTYEGIKTYQALNGPVPSSISDLSLPIHVTADTCSRPPEMVTMGTQWEVEVKPKEDGRTGTIKYDRYINFQ